MKKENPIIEQVIPLTVGEKLSLIQMELKIGKAQFNKFGNYKFRSAEDVLEALKPFNQKYGVYFTVNEQLVNANPPIMQSVATIWDCESGKSIDCSAVVGIDLDQKGMAMPQRYGSASSYAKKYSLGNLLLIDNTEDPDATNTHAKETKVATKVELVKPTMLLNSKEYEGARQWILDGGDISKIEQKYLLTEDVKKALQGKIEL
jgi:hypothetical protein